MNNFIDYSLKNLYTPTVDPLMGAEPITQDDIAKATTWLAARCINIQGKLRIKWFELPDHVFTTLGVCCPPLAHFEKSLVGIKMLLKVIGAGITDELQ